MNKPIAPHSATVQWLHEDKTVGLLRVFPAGLAHGDPYNWCATVRVIRTGVAELLGVLMSPTIDQVRACRAALNAEGITLIIFERHYLGMPHELHAAA